MLTEGEHRMLAWIARTTSLTYALPLAWNDEHPYRKLSAHRTKWRQIADGLSLGLTGLKTAFLIIRLIPGQPAFGYDVAAELNGRIPWYLIIHVLTLIPYILILVAQIGGLYCAGDLTTLVNQLFHFNQATGKQLLDCEYAKSSLREWIISNFSRYFMLMIILAITLCALFPRNTYNVLSLVPEGWPSYVFYIPALAIEIYGWVKIYMVDWFIFCTGYAYIMTTKFWLKNACLNWIAAPEEHLRESSLHTYRSLQILNILYNNGFSSVRFPILKAALESGGMFLWFGTMRLYHFTELWIYIMFPIAAPFTILQLVSTISFMATVSEMSSEFQPRFRNLSRDIPDSKLVRRRVRACRPIFCRIGSIFFVEKSTKLAYPSFLFSTFISLLLTV